MKINLAQATITTQTLQTQKLQGDRQAERALLTATGKSRLEEAANEVVGMTFFATLLKQAQTDPSKRKYFYGGPGERVFSDQLNQELARRISLSGKLNLGGFLMGSLADRQQAQATETGAKGGTKP